MLRSILYCAADNFFSIFVVNVHVSAPYVITGRIHWLKTFLFKHVGSVLFIIVLHFSNACHLAVILLLISLSWFFSIGLGKHTLLLDQVGFHLHILPWLFFWFLQRTLSFLCSFSVHISCLRCPALEALLQFPLQHELLF